MNELLLMPVLFVAALGLLEVAARMRRSGTWRAWVVVTLNALGIVAVVAGTYFGITSALGALSDTLDYAQRPDVYDSYTYTDSEGDEIKCATRNGFVKNCWED